MIRATEEESRTTTNIWVGNIPYDYIERDIEEMFGKYGPLKGVKGILFYDLCLVPMDRFTQKNRGFRFLS